MLYYWYNVICLVKNWNVLMGFIKGMINNWNIIVLKYWMLYMYVLVICRNLNMYNIDNLYLYLIWIYINVVKEWLFFIE